MKIERFISPSSPAAKMLRRCITTKIDRFITGSSPAKSRLIPYSSELITSRGRPLENITIGYHQQVPANSSGQRRVLDGFLEVMLPFSTNDELRDAMIRSDGLSIRYGKLFEILDSLAADVCFRHLGFTDTLDNDKFLVTASVDGATTTARIDPSQDLKLQAYLCYVGASTMDCQIDIISGGTKVGDTHFIMAARYKEGGKAPVYGLHVPESDLVAVEKFNRGKLRATARRAKAQSSLDRFPPTAEEVAVMHKLFLDSNEVKVQKAAIVEAYLSLGMDDDSSSDNGSDVPSADSGAGIGDSGGSGGSGSSGAGSGAGSADSDADRVASVLGRHRNEFSMKFKSQFKSRRNFKWMRNLTFRNTFFMNP